MHSLIPLDPALRLGSLTTAEIDRADSLCRGGEGARHAG